MNKKNIVFVILLVIFTLCGVFISRQSKVIDVYENNETNIKKSKNMLSMMLETESGSGNYEMTTRESWTTEGYIFNTELSKCENGGELSWDDTNKIVLMSGNVSDKCYVYFDKFTAPTISDITLTTGNDTITVTITAQSGTKPIQKYFYSKDNGTTYVEASENTYTFSDLSSGSYTIKAYVQDGYSNSSSILSKTLDFVKIFTFYIGNNTEKFRLFYAKDGMTWKEWLDSDYSKNNTFIDGTNAYFVLGSNAVYCATSADASSGYPVNCVSSQTSEQCEGPYGSASTTLINEGATYYCNMSRIPDIWNN